MTEIILARHGETDWNSGRRVQGHTDIPLNAAGVDQARALAEQLAGEPLTAVFSSDLSRALDTARAVADVHGLEVTVDPRLREKNFGTWEGLTDVEIAERFPEARRGQWGDGETTEEVAERVLGRSRSDPRAASRTGRCSLSPTEGPCAPPSPRWRSSTVRSATAPSFAAATERTPATRRRRLMAGIPRSGDERTAPRGAPWKLPVALDGSGTITPSFPKDCETARAPLPGRFHNRHMKEKLVAVAWA